MGPVVPALERELGVPVTFIEHPEDAVRTTKRMKRGEVALVENTRFFPGEEQNDPATSKMFAALGDFYVNDAFGTAHRAHASTAGVAHLIKPAVAGFLMAKETTCLGKVLNDPVRPFVAVLGGAKIGGKIDIIEALLVKVDWILIGGAMACTFFAAMGLATGTSLVETDRIEMARELLKRAGDKLVIPDGAAVAQALERGAAYTDVSREEIPSDRAMYDLDENSANKFAGIVLDSKTVLWNGPMGVFEVEPFERGTRIIAQAMARATAEGATTVVGGGDSAAALRSLGLSDAMSHVSTGGGASLKFLEGKELPGLSALDDA
ncbi:MAG: phosphoglycerate kinase [Gemmatimonadales bacterium]